ncbi:MAG: ribonuclease E/G [Lachnospiraceae bacterium]|nr:ribonuclease E/G [Lachnospiraceae bacterium]
MASDKGKILILQLNEKLLALLLRDNQILSAQVCESAAHAVGNVYVGRVQSISENIGAAFVDLGQEYLTFLPLSEAKYACITNRRPDDRLKAGDELLVQIVKEPMKTKLAGVTTRLSLSGQYAVVGMRAAEKESRVQVSSKLSVRQQEHFRSLEALQTIVEKYYVIVRTNAGTLVEETPLLAEAESLSKTLTHLLEIAPSRTCYSCLYRSKPDYAAFVENAYRNEYYEVITDLPEVYDALVDLCRDADIPLRFYEDSLLPLYKLYAVESRMQELLAKKVWLKSGGYLVIEPTEALISIDVNTGKCESGKAKEETFLRINREAAEMIALHLRARNLSGIILVDFINMKSKANETELLEHMRSLLKKDPIPAKALDMTRLGLMELTRKKIEPSLAEQLRQDRKEETT